MEDISGANVTATAASSSAPRRDNALLNQSLDDIIKLNRSQRRTEKKKPAGALGKQRRGDGNQKSQGPRTGRRNNNNNKSMMMDTTPVNIQKSRGNRRPVSSDRTNSSKGGKVIIRSNSGRPANNNNNNNNVRNQPRRPNSTPGLRQPWEKLATAPIPVEPLKISIRNELAERSARRSDPSMMMDTDIVTSNNRYNNHRGMSVNAPAYEPRDSLASREEYRIGNRFSTQGMAIDYQLPSGATFDTRPNRRY